MLTSVPFAIRQICKSDIVHMKHEPLVLSNRIWMRISRQVLIAQYNVGYCWIWVEKDVKKAIEQYQKAVEQGCYQHGIGVDKDAKKVWCVAIYDVFSPLFLWCRSHNPQLRLVLPLIDFGGTSTVASVTNISVTIIVIVHH